MTLNKKKKDWVKKYYKIIQELETMVDIYLQIQDIVKQANAVNDQLADIGTILLQIREIHKMQVEGDIYSILEELCNIIHRDMERQAYYIQVLLADELDQYKEREVETVNEYVKTLQEAYQEAY